MTREEASLAWEGILVWNTWKTICAPDYRVVCGIEDEADDVSRIGISGVGKEPVVAVADVDGVDDWSAAASGRSSHTRY